ncbi:MAG TPA: DUF2309 domain-containing protein [Gemmataceae bacterium]|nr:DUF2309 domain-containing protein [Gemmataceae bacterium]
MSSSAATDGRYRVLREAIERAAHLLPAQGPITVFIHHNTLHAFEDLPFDQALEHGTQIFGGEPYLPESSYRDALTAGRIRADDLWAVLEDDLGISAVDGVARLVSRIDLRLAMLQYPLRSGPAEELSWFVAMTDALQRVSPMASVAVKQKLIAETRRWVMRDLRGRNGTTVARRQPDWVNALFEKFGESRIESWSAETWEAVALEALWHVCREGVQAVPEFTEAPSIPLRHRDLLLQMTGIDIDLLVNPILIRFSAAFVDQGVAHWVLPDREKGFFQAFASLYRKRASPVPWLRRLAREMARLQDAQTSALDSILESLAALGVPESAWDTFLEETLLSLRGWAGIIQQIEIRGDRVPHAIPAGTLTEFLAVRLLLERFALIDASQQTLGYTGPLASLRDELRKRCPRSATSSEQQRAFSVFELAQVLGWPPDRLLRRTAEEWADLIREIEAFGGIQRRRALHAAYEKRFREQALDALALHAPQPAPATPRFQVITCLDEREESFRRHLEEAASDCETFSAAGFFGVAMYYRGSADAHFVPLCPIVIQPRHYVEERSDDAVPDAHRRRQARRLMGTVFHNIHRGTRGILTGAFLTAALGVLATIPLIARTLSPRLAAGIRARLARFVHPPRTRLGLERSAGTPGSQGEHLGYTSDEMTDLAERQLRDIGLLQNFSRLVLFIGHGSRSMNNPHASAYDCGACGGSAGGANARAIAAMLNDGRVRAGLAHRGLVIPADTWFLGALHNTCDETLRVFDEDLLPGTHRADLDYARTAIEQALGGNAHERCRRFESAPLTLTFAGAREHVENRSEDLAQVRPEMGHATNAICIVGRRQRTRGLFLDRRAFLVSYDPTRDDAEATILARVLAAAVPVCAGISLEYYFCRVDSTGWGCGTKLPHNITSLVGVMDGAASDMRTGLPWQMVEIHEPMRLLIVVETTPAVIVNLMSRNAAIDRLVRNRWVRLAVLDPHSSRIELFEYRKFFPYQPVAERLPTAESSVDWYRGWRDHLEFAEVGKCYQSHKVVEV